VKVVAGGVAYALRSDDVRDGLRTVDHGAIDAIVMSGTGMLTLPAIVGNGNEGGTPFLSSNLCCAWWLMQRTGATPPPLFGAASPRLAALLPQSLGEAA